MAFFSRSSSQDNSGEPSGRKKTAWGIAFMVLLAFLRFVFRAPALAARLFGDDRELARLNRVHIPQAQRQTPDSKRRVVAFVMLGLLVVQLTLLAFIGKIIVFGDWKHKFWQKIVGLKMPRFAEIFDYHTVAILVVVFFILSVVANIQYFRMFVYKNSKYQKLLRALRDNQVGERDGVDKPWFYPDRLLYLDLIGVTGEDVVNRMPMWHQGGFEPTKDVIRLEGHNKYIFTAAPRKPSTSTMFADRYGEWTSLIQDTLRLYNWFLGEYVNRNEYKFKDCYNDFSIAFIGQSGSGKTEAMKMWLTAFFCMHPATRLVLCDLKMTGDWDVFGPLCESGSIVKSVESTLLAILYFDDLLAQRTKYMQEKGYKNIKSWSEAEGIEVPPILLIIDEFPQMNGPLKFDIQSRRDGTPANALFKLMTKGRSFGLWVIVGSQFSGSDAIPSEMNKNIKVHVTLRTGSEGESMQWINSPVAFRLGKGKRRPDGTEDGQQGYAYIDAEEEFVRFWYMDDWFITHELLKYGVQTLEGCEHKETRVPSIPMDINNTIKALKAIGKTEKNLSDYNRERLANHEKSVEVFKKSFEQLKAEPNPRLSDKKKPLGTLWHEGETVEDYVARARKAQGQALPAGQGSAGALPGRGPSFPPQASGQGSFPRERDRDRDLEGPASRFPGGAAGPGQAGQAGAGGAGPGKPPVAPQGRAGQPAGPQQSMEDFLDSLRAGDGAKGKGTAGAAPGGATRTLPAHSVPSRALPPDDESDIEFQKELDKRRTQRRETLAKANQPKKRPARTAKLETAEDGEAPIPRAKPAPRAKKPAPPVTPAPFEDEDDDDA